MVASRMNAQRIDDRPQERESPVRHAHAAQASRHGRASARAIWDCPRTSSRRTPAILGATSAISLSNRPTARRGEAPAGREPAKPERASRRRRGQLRRGRVALLR